MNFFDLGSFDPRTKLMLMACLSTLAMLTKSLWFLGVLLGATLLILLLGRVALAKMRRQIAMALGFVGFLLIIQCLFVRSGMPIMSLGGFTLIYDDGLNLGLLLSMRLLILLMSALILLTGEVRDYLLALTQCKVPYEIAFMVMIGFHFFPILKTEALNVFYSIQLRGSDLQKNSLRQKLQIYFKICLPILAGAIYQAKTMSMAMEARCFRLLPYRTYARQLVLSLKDKICLVCLPVFSVAVLVFSSFL